MGSNFHQAELVLCVLENLIGTCSLCRNLQCSPFNEIFVLCAGCNKFWQRVCTVLQKDLFQNDPLTIQKCQTIISEMLQSLKLTSVSSTLQMMIESQVNCRLFYREFWTSVHIEGRPRSKCTEFATKMNKVCKSE